MIRAPRCPVCKTWLSADRTIDETYLPDEAAWNYRYACASCLSVVAQRIPEISESRPRVTASAPSIDVAGSVVARVLTGLHEAAGEGRLADTVTALVEDEKRRVLLRVPEVFAVARPGWGDAVQLADRVWYPVSDASLDVERRAPSTVLTRFVADRTSSIQVVLSRGDRLRVVRVEETRFVLHRISGARLDADIDPAELVAAPDLVVPDLGSGA